MENQTAVNILFLNGLSDLPSLQIPLFLLFLVIYLLTLTTNLLIFLLIFTDPNLQTPMYSFLGTLASLDTGYSTVTTPEILFDLITERRDISVRACLTQIYFFSFFATSEVCMLAVMSYDRYIAICRPLHYMQIMNWKVCAELILGVLIFSVVYSLVHTLFLTKLNFCSSNVLQSFFCDIPQLLQVSCSDTYINVLLIFLLGTLFGVVILAATFYPYIPIINTILKVSENMRSKAFSTCSSHLTVVFIFYGTLLFNYYRPNAKYHFTEDKVASVFYATLIPFLNPLIYSLRNKELKTSIRRSLCKL